ncbi:hypothetical protein Pyn_40961 [Prunus yedoensis var. nudiflora]|uniref:Uncharacterized protein n=1 Tax=Prunus yedoensis var. nudiflora TaxID=2094558 RepID=A0A314UHB6_PRUYE|nr:hypothetical protein Pyn_40961 [Prunus yedoensis var. nudiflora]
MAVCGIEEKDKERAERIVKVALWCVQKRAMRNQKKFPASCRCVTYNFLATEMTFLGGKLWEIHLDTRRKIHGAAIVKAPDNNNSYHQVQCLLVYLSLLLNIYIEYFCLNLTIVERYPSTEGD